LDETCGCNAAPIASASVHPGCTFQLLPRSWITRRANTSDGSRIDRSCLVNYRAFNIFGTGWLREVVLSIARANSFAPGKNRARKLSCCAPMPHGACLDVVLKTCFVSLI
jgi:hypothetical protein